MDDLTSEDSQLVMSKVKLCPVQQGDGMAVKPAERVGHSAYRPDVYRNPEEEVI